RFAEHVSAGWPWPHRQFLDRFRPQHARFRRPAPERAAQWRLASRCAKGRHGSRSAHRHDGYASPSSCGQAHAQRPSPRRQRPDKNAERANRRPLGVTPLERNSAHATPPKKTGRHPEHALSGLATSALAKVSRVPQDGSWVSLVIVSAGFYASTGRTWRSLPLSPYDHFSASHHLLI